MPCNCSGFCFMNEPYLYLVNEIKNFEVSGSYKDMLNRYLQHRIDINDKKVYKITDGSTYNEYSSNFKQFKDWVKKNEKPTFNYFKMLSLHLKDDADDILKEYYDGFMEIQHNNEANDEMFDGW